MHRRMRILKRVAQILRVSWYHAFGALFLMVRCYGPAEGVFRRGRTYAERMHPESVGALDAWIAFVYERRGDTEKALQLLRSRVEANPQNVSCLLDLADCHLAVGDKERAIHVYRKALALETDADAQSSIRSQIARAEQA